MKLTFSLLAAATFSALALPVLAEDNGIVVYNAQHDTLTQAWADGFTAETGIKVTLRNGEDLELANQIVQEGTASPADVFLTENSPGVVLVDNAGLLEKLPNDIVEQVPAPFQPSSGNWTPIAARATVFAYNTTLLKPEELPKSIMDLAGPEWQGKWAASPAGADFQAIVSAMLSLKGEPATADWLKAMKANVVPFRGNTAAMKGVNAGQVAGAVIYHYYFFGDRSRTGENSANVGLHFFKGEDPGGFVSLSGGAVLKSSQHKEQALAFLKWVAGKGGQEILKTGTSFEYAVGVGADSNPALPPLATLEPPKVDPSSLNSEKVSALMTDAGLI